MNRKPSAADDELLIKPGGLRGTLVWIGMVCAGIRCLFWLVEALMAVDSRDGAIVVSLLSVVMITVVLARMNAILPGGSEPSIDELSLLEEASPPSDVRGVLSSDSPMWDGSIDGPPR